MYKISRIERVFNKNKAINRFLWEFLAAFHKATPGARVEDAGGWWVGGVQGKSQKNEKKIAKIKVFGSVWERPGI